MAKRNGSDGHFIKDESLLTDGQKKRIKKVSSRIVTNNEEAGKWSEVLKAEQAQDMKKIAIHTAEVVEAINARGEYLRQKKEAIIEQINEEHRGGSSISTASLVGEPDELDKATSNHVDQSGEYVKFKAKKRKLVRADGSKVNLGAGEKIELEDNTFDEVVDFISQMNEKFPDLGLVPDDISFGENDTMDTLARLKEHFEIKPILKTVEPEPIPIPEVEPAKQEAVEVEEPIEVEPDEDAKGVKIRLVGVVLDDEQQLLISGLEKDNLEDIVSSDKYEELFPASDYVTELDDGEGSDLYIKQIEKEETETEDDSTMSLEEALAKSN